MAEEGSSVGAGLVSDSHRVLWKDTDTHGGRFELTDDIEDVQFDSECLDKDHVIKLFISLIRGALPWKHDTCTQMVR